MSLELSIQNLADAINRLAATQEGGDTKAVVEQKPTTKKPKAEKEKPEATEKTVEEAEVSKLTLDKVIPDFEKFIAQKGRDDTVALLEAHGVKKLAEITDLTAIHADILEALADE